MLRLILFIATVLLVNSETTDQKESREEHILGSSVHLKCVCNVDKPVKTASWDFSGKHLVTDNNKYTVSKKKLTISRLDLRDKGLYKCILSFYNSSQTCRHNTHLDVLYPPVILKKPSTAPVMEGQELELSCLADGNPAVKHEWLKEKMITDLIRAKVKLSENSQNLTIPKIKKSDEGRYFCKVSNTLGTKETFVDVKILIPPSVKLSSSRVIQAENTSLNLICETAGVPLPKLAWVIASKETMSSSDHSLRLQPGIAIITIPHLKREHTGNITCQASNSAGFNSSSASITVQYIPEVYTNVNEVKAWPGLDLLLSCNISSEPLAHVTWYKNSQVISSTDANTSVSSVKVSDQLLVTTLMTSLDSDLIDENIYACEARNSIGSSKKNILVLKEALPEQPEIEFIDEGHESVRIIMKSHSDNAESAAADINSVNDASDEEEEKEDGSERVYSNDSGGDAELDDVYFKDVKIKKKTDKNHQKSITKKNLSNEFSHKELFDKINFLKNGNKRPKLPLLYWKVTVESSKESSQQPLIFPYANEIILENLTPSVMYNVTIVVSNFVGYSPPLYTQVFTSDAPTYTLDKNMSLYRGGSLERKASKKLSLLPSNAEGDIVNGFGFIVLVGIGSVIVLVVIFVLSALVLYWQKRSLEKARLLGKCPHHNVVTTLTRHDLEAHRCEQETLTRRGDRVADLSGEATVTAHLSPIGYYKGDTVDDVIDHLNMSYCNK